MLRSVEKSNQITVEFSDVCAHVPLLFVPQQGMLSWLPKLGKGKDDQVGGGGHFYCSFRVS